MKSLVRLAVLAAVAFPALASGQMAPPQPPRIITSGEAEVRVTPDRASVMIGVQTRALTAAAAGADNAKRQKAIIDTLKSMGLTAEQLTTQNYSVQPEIKYDPNTGGSGRVTGYTVSNTVRAELRRIDMTGAVIDAALAKGANQIHGVQFSTSTAAEARRTAMSDAVRNARADAEALARAAGGSLGSLIELTSATPSVRPMFGDMAMSMAKAERVPTPIEPGEQVITANVSAIWAFIPGSNK